MPKHERLGTDGIDIWMDVQDSTIGIRIICKDAYGARIMYDDMIERIERGEGIMLENIRKEEKSG